MKEIVILISISGLTLLSCNKDDVMQNNPDINKPRVQDSAKTSDPTKAPVELPNLNIVGKDTFLFKDFDGNVYHAIQIGRQIWSKENLKTTHYNDGTSIPNAQGTSQWLLWTEAYCCYNNDASFSAKYGLLYNYRAAISGKLAPKGWHVATMEDWNTLMLYIGNQSFSTIGDVGALVDSLDWPKAPFHSIHDYQVKCTNSTHFTALPNGYRDNSWSRNLPEFDCLGSQASWWALTDGSGAIIYLDQDFGIFNRTDRPMSTGSGIRLVKDAD